MEKYTKETLSAVFVMLFHQKKIRNFLTEDCKFHNALPSISSTRDVDVYVKHCCLNELDGVDLDGVKQTPEEATDLLQLLNELEYFQPKSSFNFNPALFGGKGSSLIFMGDSPKGKTILVLENDGDYLNVVLYGVNNSLKEDKTDNVSMPFPSTDKNEEF